jgi:integrase
MKEMREYYLKQDPPVNIPVLNPHELRHTRATLWVNDGKNLLAIAETMGWGDLKMLRQRYAHSDVNVIRNALDL